jgi:hypothetical protein
MTWPPSLSVGRARPHRVGSDPPDPRSSPDGYTKYEFQNGKPELMRLPKPFFNDNFVGKAIGIDLFIGKRPYAAFGNSTSDREMLEWTGAGNGARLKMLVYHDDRAGICLWSCSRTARHQGRHVLPIADGRDESAWLDGDQYEEDWKRIFTFAESSCDIDTVP